MSSKKSEATAGFNQGLRALRRYLSDFEESALPHAIDHFRAALQRSPERATLWIALGFALDMKDEPKAALGALRRAAELDSGDEEVEVYVLTLMAETGQESEALRGIENLAGRRGVDIDSLRHDLTEAGMGVGALTILKNGFVYPRNFIRSRLEDMMDRAESSNESLECGAKADREDCRERLAELRREVNSERVPAELQQLLPWVLRLGIGDDPCRHILIEELTRDERIESLQEIRRSQCAAHAWLDSFGAGPLTPEAAAFMYTLLAAEEIGE